MTQYVYIVGRTCLTDDHSHRHPMRESQKEGVAPEGGQLVHAVYGEP